MIPLGVPLGSEDGAALSSLLGVELGAAEGALLGSLLGSAPLGEELRDKRGPVFGPQLGETRPIEGAPLALGDELGASLGAVSPFRVGSKLGTELRLPGRDEQRWVSS
jgi:hypothetical protein